MRIDNDKGCNVASCPVDLGPNCTCLFFCLKVIFESDHTCLIGPAALKGPYDSSGFPVGCRSACQAGLAPDPGKQWLFSAETTWHSHLNTANSPNCCTGSHNTAATCPPSGVEYYSYFSTRFLSFCLRSMLIFDCANRGQLPRCLRVCVRRKQRHCALAVRCRPWR